MDEDEDQKDGGTSNPEGNKGGDGETKTITMTEEDLQKTVAQSVERALARERAKTPGTPEPKDKSREATLQNRIATLEKDKQEKEEQLARQERESGLRTLLEAQGVVDLDLALRGIVPEFAVEEGKFIHDRNGVVTPVEKVVETFLADRPYLKGEKPREGGGSIGRSSRSPGIRKDPIDPKLEGMDLCRASMRQGYHKED